MGAVRESTRDEGSVPGRMPDVLVVGGGVIGLTSAWMLAGAGMSVTLADPKPGRGATWAAAGMLAPVSEVHYGEEGMARLLVEGAHRWPAFAAALEECGGGPIGYRPCGTVVVAADTSDRAVVDDLVALPRHLGLDVRALTARQCRAALPALAPGIRGGAEMATDHQVDNRGLVDALVRACQRRRVEFVREEVRQIEQDRAGAVRGVAMSGGSRIPARKILVAAGARTANVGGLPQGVLPPIRPVKGHVVRLKGPRDRPLLTRTVRGLVHGRSCYLVPKEDGTVVIGATEEERGFDDSVQAGAVHDLLHDARTLVPGIDELVLEECATGLRPGSPDNCPFIGWTALEGLAVAAGHYRHGILLAPLTAAGMTELLAGGALPEELRPFDPRRGALR